MDLRRNLDDISHEEENPPAENVQEQQEHEEEEGNLQKEDQPRIAVNSLLDDSMPAMTTSKKRNRATAALDEAAGPATVKRSQSQSRAAGVSSKRPSKPTRPVPTLVIPDSDDPFPDEDDEGNKHELFDLTENDTLPEANKVVKEDTSTKLCKFECIICLDAASTLTVTHCGMSLSLFLSCARRGVY